MKASLFVMQKKKDNQEYFELEQDKDFSTLLLENMRKKRVVVVIDEAREGECIVTY